LLPARSAFARAAFTGENGEFRRLVTRGALLELVTFGFYRFWLATNIRRHLWSNNSVARDALEYTGTGREFLLGFLFAWRSWFRSMLDKADSAPAGEFFLSFGEWRALKAICK